MWRIRVFLILTATILFVSLQLQINVAASNSTDTNSTKNKNELVSFPYEGKPCTCKLLDCTCCQGFMINPIQFGKSICMQFKLKIFPIRADIKVMMDNNTIAEFIIDPSKPPKYCIPIIVPVPVAACLQLHDVKLIGFSGLQICSTFFVNYLTDEIFAFKFPCVKLSSDGIDIMSK